jgi:acetoin utilization deacetylase AcuC-like enzyme
VKIVFSQRFLQHAVPYGHPEVPARLEAIARELAKHGIGIADSVEPKPASESEIALAHSAEHVARVKQLSASEAQAFPDNPFAKQTFEIAALAAGAAIEAARLAVKEKEFGFALCRPPGHHASRERFSGFCYFNNLAIAVRWLQKRGLARRVFIVDFDVHCGDGTEKIFYGDSSVFYYSIHQNPATIFPYTTGFPEQDNEHVRNVCVEPGVGDGEYLEIFSESLTPLFQAFKPDCIAVSAGFDSYYLDGAAGNALQIRKSETYARVGALIRKLAGAKPIFGALEGGYFLPKLGENAWAFLKEFA